MIFGSIASLQKEIYWNLEVDTYYISHFFTFVIAMSETGTLVLPEVNPATILQNENVQEVIATTVANGVAKSEEIEAYYKEGLEKMFANQNMTLDEFTKVFNQVIDLEAAKADAKQVIQAYIDEGSNSEVTEALKVLDEELREINPLFKKIKRALEWSAWFFGRIKMFFRNLFWWKNDDLVTSTLEGIKGRVDSVEEAFERYEDKLTLNQATAEKYIPDLGVEIYKLDGMATALETVNKDVEHDGTKDFLNNMIWQLHTISGIKKGNLQRFIMAARMNGNSQLLLKATQFKVFGVMPSLLALNFVLATQKKVNEVSDIADKFMEEMVEASKTQLDENMSSEVEAKNKMIEQLQKVTADIDRLENRVSTHRENLWLAQQALDNYMPLYKEKIRELDESIFETNISDSDFLKVSETIINKMEEQEKELNSINEKESK